MFLVKIWEHVKNLDSLRIWNKLYKENLIEKYPAEFRFIVSDTLDILCIWFSIYSRLAFLVRIYRKSEQTNTEDPIIMKLKRYTNFKFKK